MPIYTSPSHLPASLSPDVLLLGGGTAASVVAGRLARCTPAPTILVVEAGDNNQHDAHVTSPGNYMQHQQPGAPRLKRYVSTRASEFLGGRQAALPVAQSLGGGSSVNFMMYTRASGSDYDAWEAAGWDAQALLPCLKKFEDWHGEGDGETHGRGGPIGVGYGGWREERLMLQLEEAVVEMGYDVVADANDLKTGNAFQKWMKYIDPATQMRSDAAHRYLHPLIPTHENLHILCNTTVSRVLFSTDSLVPRAVGAEIVPSPAEHFSTEPPPSSPQTVLAKKLVIVCGGALGSPLILERSGIGGTAVLQQAGVPQLVDLPGVGEAYQDHNLLLPAFELDSTIQTHDKIFSSLSTGPPSDIPTGQMGSNALDFGGKIRPSPAQLSRMPETFQQYYHEAFTPHPDKPLAITIPIAALLAGHENFPPDSRFATVALFTGYPVSRGRVHILSPSAYAHPELDAGFLSSELDVPPLMWGYKVLREMMRRVRSCIGEVAGGNPAFPSAKVRYERPEGWTPAVVRDVVYTDEDEKELECWVRANVLTTWHGLGTCAMKAREDGGVVDAKLRVYGTEALMVADMSIAPGNVGSNTNNTALMIGEKAAILAAEYLGIELS